MHAVIIVLLLILLWAGWMFLTKSEGLLADVIKNRSVIELYDTNKKHHRIGTFEPGKGYIVTNFMNGVPRSETWDLTPAQSRLFWRTWGQLRQFLTTQGRSYELSAPSPGWTFRWKNNLYDYGRFPASAKRLVGGMLGVAFGW